MNDIGKVIKAHIDLLQASERALYQMIDSLQKAHADLLLAIERLPNIGDGKGGKTDNRN